jgi:hypothetical protein
MSVIETCKACQSQLADAGIPVGQWKFCQGCFDKMMSEKTVQADLQASELSPEDVEIERKAASMSASFLTELATRPKKEDVCRICEELSPTNTYLSVVGLKVCEACYANMLPPSTRETTAKQEASEPPAPVEPTTIEPVAMRTHACAGCNRPITPRGAREVDGGLLCPDCFYSRQDSSK